jgi:aryl-alcohol dehydrogenase-like predicted oxidoreductase
MERRDFMKSTLAGALAAGRVSAKDEIPRRAYRDGVQISVIGFGGIVVMGHEPPEAARLVSKAIDAGVNYFDVAPSYGDGEAEIKLGNALAPYRKKVFLACKTTRRDAEGARQELERSLERLHTDHFDLYQFHAVTTMKDVDEILAPGGAAETFTRARKEGKVRYLGASAHSPAAAIALMDRFRLDSILFPVNFVCWEQGGFGPQILEHAKKKGVTRLALKAMAHTKWPEGAQHPEYPNCWYQPVDTPELARKAVRFTLSQDVTAAIPPGHERLWQMALDAARGFKPLSQSEQAELLASTKGVAPIFNA